MKRAFLSTVLIAALAGCGGSQKSDDDGLGQNHAGGGGNPSDDLDVDKTNGTNGTGDGGETGDDGSQQNPDEIKQPPPKGPPFTFVLKNTDEKEELAFNMDYGWGANVQMYSGEPPKAKVVLPFETFCTAECGADDECPKCKQPEKLGDIKKAQQIETVKPGESLKLEWDGTVHTYKKVKGKCKCFTKAAPPPETYKFRVCGLRLTKSAKHSTRPICSEPIEITMPPSEPEQTIELEFGAPAGDKKKSKKKKKR